MSIVTQTPVCHTKRKGPSPCCLNLQFSLDRNILCNCGLVYGPFSKMKNWGFLNQKDQILTWDSLHLFSLWCLLDNFLSPSTRSDVFVGRKDKYWVCEEREAELAEEWERCHQLGTGHSFQHVLVQNKAEMRGSMQQPVGRFESSPSWKPTKWLHRGLLFTVLLHSLCELVGLIHSSGRSSPLYLVMYACVLVYTYLHVSAFPFAVLVPVFSVSFYPFCRKPLRRFPWLALVQLCFDGCFHSF